MKLNFKEPAVSELVSKAIFRSWGSQLNGTQQVFFGDSLPAVNLFTASSKVHQKIVLFGKAPKEIPSEFGISNVTGLGIIDRAGAEPVVQFQPHRLTQSLHLKSRAFKRFDFTNEWNNLGYGEILSASNAIWSLAEPSSTYAALYEGANTSILWFNRPVGPIDGFDWRIVEEFIENPIPEFPTQYIGAVTMRIDCDEAIASGRKLFELYRKYDFPFSMAIKTSQSIQDEDIRLMKDVIAAGGSIVTHSHSHAPNWGGSRDAAKLEVEISNEILKSLLPEYYSSTSAAHYAVSPFHQNPQYAVEGIRDAGIRGFVGGIIHNDPEYLMARSGPVPFVDGIISHTEQCMLHGDCYHQAGNSIQTYVDAWKSALSTKTFFGFLDHPFSAYQYGWHTEDERLGVHEEFLQELARTPNVWRASLVDTLEFLVKRTQSK